MHLLLVEDHRLFADALEAMMRELEPRFAVTASYSAQHALGIIDSGRPFDLVLADLRMPGIGGLGLLDALRHRRSELPVVVISAFDDERSVRAAMERGAAGFIPKTLPAATLLAALREVLAGRKFFPERYLARPVSGLSEGVPRGGAGGRSDGRPGERQLQVLQLMADGHSNKQISEIVRIKEATVKYHTSQLFRLLGVRNRTSCVREAQARGLVAAFGEPAGPAPDPSAPDSSVPGPAHGASPSGFAPPPVATLQPAQPPQSAAGPDALDVGPGGDPAAGSGTAPADRSPDQPGRASRTAAPSRTAPPSSR